MLVQSENELANIDKLITPSSQQSAAHDSNLGLSETTAKKLQSSSQTEADADIGSGDIT